MSKALAAPRRRMAGVVFAAVLLNLLLGPAVEAQVRARINPNEVKFNLPTPQAAPDPFLAGGVSLGQNVPIYFSSGIGPSALNTTAPGGTPERYIDPAQYAGGVLPSGVTITEAQGMNAMARIKENLDSQG